MHIYTYSNSGLTGHLTITSYDLDGNLLREQHETNRVVSSDGHGRNLIIRQFTGDTSYGMKVDEGKIGTDDTAPTDSDTDLGTVVTSGIIVESSSVSNDQGTFQFFILDGDLPDGTYNEFGLFIGGQMLARSVFTNSYSKSAGENTRVDYTLALNAS